MSGFSEELSSGANSDMSEATRQRVEDILTASATELLGKEAEAEMNARLNALAKKAEGLAIAFERSSSKDVDTHAITALLSDDEDSYVKVDDIDKDATKPIVRDDVTQAHSVPGRLKKKLHYCQGDHLEMAEAKVKLRPVLEGDIDGYERQYRDVTRNEALAAVHHIAEIASETVSDIKRIGQQEEASVVLATDVLKQIGQAFATCCHTLQVDTQSKKEAEKALEQFREDSLSRLEKLRVFDMPAAQLLLEKAFKELSASQIHAMSELSDVNEQVKQVEKSNRLKYFDSLKREVKETVNEELRELELIQEHCGQDIIVAEQQQQELEEKHDECTKTFRATVRNYETELNENQRQQKKLLQKLEQLRDKEQLLTEAKEKEEQMQETAMTATVLAAEQIDEEINKTRSLDKRANSSILIMKKTRELSDLVFNAVEQKEQDLQETVSKRRTKAIDIYRKALLESAVAHKIRIRDHNVNITHMKEQIKQLSLERRQKAQTALSARVSQIQNELQELEVELRTERQEREKNKEELEALERQIEKMDRQYTGIDQLESVETLYNKRMTEIQEFWEMHADGMTIDSITLDDH